MRQAERELASAGIPLDVAESFTDAEILWLLGEQRMFLAKQIIARDSLVKHNREHASDKAIGEAAQAIAARVLRDDKRIPAPKAAFIADVMSGLFQLERLTGNARQGELGLSDAYVLAHACRLVGLPESKALALDPALQKRMRALTR